MKEMIRIAYYAAQVARCELSLALATERAETLWAVTQRPDVRVDWDALCHAWEAADRAHDARRDAESALGQAERLLTAARQAAGLVTA